MNIFLTGVTGFIGSHVARQLVQGNDKIYVLVREESSLNRIQDIVPFLNIVWGDLSDRDTIRQSIHGIRPDLCIHLAWYAVPGHYLTAPENIHILTATLYLAQQLADVGCRRLIAAGTCLEYNTDQGYLAEDRDIQPNSLYAASKYASYQVLSELSKLHKFEFAWMRFFYQYGPFEEKERLVPSIIHPLLGGQNALLTEGRQIRDFLHVEDVARAVCSVALSDIQGIVNIGSGIPTSVREIATMIGQLCNASEQVLYGAYPYRDADPIFICADNSRLVQETQWQPKYDLQTGLQQTIEWWTSQIKNAAYA